MPDPRKEDILKALRESEAEVDALKLQLEAARKTLVEIAKASCWYNTQKYGDGYCAKVIAEKALERWDVEKPKQVLLPDGSCPCYMDGEVLYACERHALKRKDEGVCQGERGIMIGAICGEPLPCKYHG